MNRAVRALVFLFALTLPARPEDTLSLGGYFKSFSILLRPPAAGLGEALVKEPDLGAVNNRLRLRLAFRPSNGLSFQCEYDMSPRIQDARLFNEDLFFPGLRLTEYRLADFRDRLYPGPCEPPASFGVYHNLDRLMLTVKTEAADIILGRQALAWGSARVVNPTDVLAPFAFHELDKEERTGVDAFRLLVPLGTMDEVDVGVVAGRKFRAGTSALYVRGRTNQLKTDLSGLAMAFRNHLLLGVDLARSIGGAGAWLEAAYVVPDAFRKNGPARGKNYLRASVGADYNFSPKTYGFVEYHFNSAGRRRPEEYLSLFGAAAYQDGAVYLMGRHYLSLGSTYQLSPLIPVTGLLMANLGDPSVVIAPSADYNISQNIYLAAGATIGLGKRPETLPGPPGPDLPPRLLHSEFGSYPDMVYASFRIYF